MERFDVCANAVESSEAQFSWLCISILGTKPKALIRPTDIYRRLPAGHSCMSGQYENGHKKG